LRLCAALCKKHVQVGEAGWCSVVL